MPASSFGRRHDRCRGRRLALGMGLTFEAQ